MPTDSEIRQQLITTLEGFSTEKLGKLVVIGNSIMTPMDTELTSVDFATMIEEVFKSGGLADQYYPTWTDRSDSDFGRFLVELFAIFSDKDFFYMNHYSKESFLGVAEEYRSLFHKAFNEGFNPPSNDSASGDIELVFASGNSELVRRGAIVIGVAEFPELVYSNEEFTIPTSGIETGVTAVFKHGRIRQDSGLFDGSTIFIDTPSITTRSVRLIIDNVEWTEVDSFLLGNSATKHFMVVYTDTGRAEILFAKRDSGMGLVPAVGQSYLVEYRIGGGYVGDISAGVLNLIISNNTARSLNSFTQFEMVGGNDQMPLEKLRQTIIGKRRTQNRVITPEDAKYFCEQLSFVKKVKTEAILNFINIYVLPIGGGNISPSQKTEVENLIDNPDQDLKKLAMGFNLFVGSATFVGLKIVVDIYLLPSTIKSSAQIKADQTLRDNLDPLKNGSFGEGFNRSTMSARLLQNVTGSTNVIFTTLHRLGVPADPNDVAFLSREVVDMSTTEITINLIGGI